MEVVRYNGIMANMKVFTGNDFASLWRPDGHSTNEDNGQVTIIGGSELFTGAPLLSLVAASRMVDMVFLATPDMDKGAAEKTVLFSRLKSVIWVPRGEVEPYIEKSNASLIGPGLMRYTEEGMKVEPGMLDMAGTETKMMTHYLLRKFSDKKWVIDGGSLQVMEREYIPHGAILTPNKKEYALLFGSLPESWEDVARAAATHNCVIAYKDTVGIVSDGETTYEIRGGNAGLTKGGTGDVQAGITVALLAKNPPLLAAAAAMYLVKKTAEKLEERVGLDYNADDVAEKVFEVKKGIVE